MLNTKHAGDWQVEEGEKSVYMFEDGCRRHATLWACVSLAALLEKKKKKRCVKERGEHFGSARVLRFWFKKSQISSFTG